MATMGNAGDNRLSREDISSALRSFHYLYDYPADLKARNGGIDADLESKENKQRGENSFIGSSVPDWKSNNVLPTNLRAVPGPINGDIVTVPTDGGDTSRATGYDRCVRGDNISGSTMQIPVCMGMCSQNQIIDSHYGIESISNSYVTRDLNLQIESHLQSDALAVDGLHGGGSNNKAFKNFDLDSAGTAPHFHVPSALTDDDEFNSLDNSSAQEYVLPSELGKMPINRQQTLSPKLFHPQLNYNLDEAQQQQTSLQRVAHAAFCNSPQQLHRGSLNNQRINSQLHQMNLDDTANDANTHQKLQGDQQRRPCFDVGVRHRRYSAKNAPINLDIDYALDTPDRNTLMDRSQQPYPSWISQRLCDDNTTFQNLLQNHQPSLSSTKKVDWRRPAAIDARPTSLRRFSVPASFLETPRQVSPGLDVYYNNYNVQDGNDLDSLASSIQALRLRDQQQHLNNQYAPHQKSPQMYTPNACGSDPYGISAPLELEDTHPRQEIYPPKQSTAGVLKQNDYTDHQQRLTQPLKACDHYQNLVSHIAVPGFDESLRRHSIEGSMSSNFVKAGHASLYKNNDPSQFKLVHRQNAQNHNEDEPSWRRKSTVHCNSSRKPSIQWLLAEDLDLSLDILFYPHLYVVEFKNRRMNFFFISPDNELSVKLGDLVIVEADRGKDLGLVVAVDIHTTKELYKYKDRYLESSSNTTYNPDTGCIVRQSKYIYPRCIYGLASPSDIIQLPSKKQDEASSVQVCKVKVRKKNLPMNIVDAEYQWDRKKLTFYFTSESRIDFRGLVRDLFKLYKTRIWMCAVIGNYDANNDHTEETNVLDNTNCISETPDDTYNTSNLNLSR